MVLKPQPRKFRQNTQNPSFFHRVCSSDATCWGVWCLLPMPTQKAWIIYLISVEVPDGSQNIDDLWGHKQRAFTSSVDELRLTRERVRRCASHRQACTLFWVAKWVTFDAKVTKREGRTQNAKQRRFHLWERRSSERKFFSVEVSKPESVAAAAVPQEKTTFAQQQLHCTATIMVVIQQPKCFLHKTTFQTWTQIQKLKLYFEPQGNQT